MDKEYKVETKPALWEVKLQNGSYSDWNIEYLFFAGNSEEEIWNFLCRYMADNKGDYEYKCGIKFGEKKFIFNNHYFGEEIDTEKIIWDSQNGDIYDVQIYQMKVIYFRK